jgi:stringent starvation protein B
MAEVSTKPYLIRAIYDWCTDSGFTPYIAVAVDETVRVPAEFVNNGEIVLNVSALATSRLLIDNEAISFQARFGGVSREVYVPMMQVIAIYARENGQGMAFEVPRALSAPAPRAVEPATEGAPAVEPPEPPKPSTDRPTTCWAEGPTPAMSITSRSGTPNHLAFPTRPPPTSLETQLMVMYRSTIGMSRMSA